MLQRIQTVFMILVALSMVASIFFPIWLTTSPATGEAFVFMPVYFQHITATGAEPAITYFPYSTIGILNVLVAMVAIYQIFQYKNRLTQMKLGALVSFLAVISVAFSMFLIYQGKQDWLPELPGTYSIGIYLSMASLVWNMLSNRFIRKDEKLIRSVDRIR